MPSRPGLGEGLFAAEDIEKGDFIIEYTGEKIRTKVADTLKTRYLFELDEKWTIDGQMLSNTARYINHSCEPNCEADTHDGHILISATRDIAAGEELGMDYGEEYFDEFIKPTGCKCGARRHRGA
jgi:SET domain-containing protein